MFGPEACASFFRSEVSQNAGTSQPPDSSEAAVGSCGPGVQGGAARGAGWRCRGAVASSCSQGRHCGRGHLETGKKGSLRVFSQKRQSSRRGEPMAREKTGSLRPLRKDDLARRMDRLGKKDRPSALIGSDLRIKIMGWFCSLLMSRRLRKPTRTVDWSNLRARRGGPIGVSVPNRPLVRPLFGPAELSNFK